MNSTSSGNRSHRFVCTEPNWLYGMRVSVVERNKAIQLSSGSDENAKSVKFDIWFWNRILVTHITHLSFCGIISFNKIYRIHWKCRRAHVSSYERTCVDIILLTAERLERMKMKLTTARTINGFGKNLFVIFFYFPIWHNFDFSNRCAMQPQSPIVMGVNW